MKKIKTRAPRAWRRMLTLMIAWPTPNVWAQLPPRLHAHWQKYLTGSAGPVEYGADAACVDAQGNVYIAGNFQDGNSFSLRVAKWSGNQWQILGDRFPGGRAEAIAVDGQGNVYLGGVFNRAVNSDGSEVIAENVAKWKYQRPIAYRGSGVVIRSSSNRKRSGSGRRTRGYRSVAGG